MKRVTPQIFKTRAERILSLVPLPNLDSDVEGDDDNNHSEENLFDMDHGLTDDPEVDRMLNDFEAYTSSYFPDRPDWESEDVRAMEDVLESIVCASERREEETEQENQEAINLPTRINQTTKKPQRKRKIVRVNFKWKSVPFRKVISLPEENNMQLDPDAEDKAPIDYFLRFFTGDILKLIVSNTNLYKTQKNVAAMSAFSDNDILDYVAILLIMGVVKMPDIRDYWSDKTRYTKVADIMSRNKFLSIRRHLHFVDNTNLDGSDRYCKIRPILDMFREDCRKIPQENRSSIDEMMVPYKGRKAGSRRMFMKNKPTKWGFKIFVRSGVSGIVYDYYIYSGEDTFQNSNMSDYEFENVTFSEQAVLSLSHSISEKPLSILFFDNWFSSPDILFYLRKEYGILSLATMRENRTSGAKFSSDKDLKKKGRGAFEQVVDNSKNISMLKWFDNKSVIIGSSYMGVDSNNVSTILRWQKGVKEKQPVPCPPQIKEYNSHMGGVDLTDMMVSLYRSKYKSKRWYMPIFGQILDLMVVNAWLLYRRDRTSQRKLLSLKEFRLQISEELVLYKRPRVKRSSADSTPKGNKKQNKTVHVLSTRIINDGLFHTPAVGDKGRCKFCQKGQTVMYCKKCNARLCVTKIKNCFESHHNGMHV